MMDSMPNPNRWIAKLSRWMNLDVADTRRHRRLRADLTVAISGPFGICRAKCLNLSRGGVSAHTVEAIEPGTLVFVRLTALDLMGFAHVRHCRADGDGFRVGLEFREGLARERTVESGWDTRSVTPQLAWDEAEA